MTTASSLMRKERGKRRDRCAMVGTSRVMGAVAKAPREDRTAPMRNPAQGIRWVRSPMRR